MKSITASMRCASCKGRKGLLPDRLGDLRSVYPQGMKYGRVQAATSAAAILPLNVRPSQHATDE